MRYNNRLKPKPVVYGPRKKRPYTYRHGGEILTAGKNKRAFKTAEFRKLQTVWYAKLAASGFTDIEYSEDTPYIKDHWIDTQTRVVRGEQSGAAALMDASILYLAAAIGSRRSERTHVALFLRGMSVVDIAARLGSTERAVKKQIINFTKRVKEHAQAYKDEQGEAGTEAEADAEERELQEHLSGAGAYAGSATAHERQNNRRTPARTD